MISEQPWFQKLDECLKSNDVKVQRQISKQVRKWYSMCVGQILRHNPGIRRGEIVRSMQKNVKLKITDLEMDLATHLTKTKVWQEERILLLCGLHKSRNVVRRQTLNALARRKVREKQRRQKRKVMLKRRHVKMVEKFLRKVEK